jgi:hypothetical protein
MDIYIDESGYTGEDFLQINQPIFVLSSVILSNKISLDIFKKFFSDLQCRELKHSRIAMRPKGQQIIIDFIKEINTIENISTLFIVHKEFNLIAKLVDLWIEPAMKKSGYNLYQDGGNIALSNLLYTIFISLLPEKLFKRILKRFQLMMRKRTKANYYNFWNDIYNIYYGEEFSDNNPVRDCMSFLLGAEIDLGFNHLMTLPERILDISVTCAITTVNYWRNKYENNFKVIHDNSSRMAKEQWLWNILVSSEVEPYEFKNIERKTIFPLNVKETILANSKDYIQLQFADIIAGAGATLFRNKLEKTNANNYVIGLEEARLMDFLIGGIWPSSEVDPKKLGTSGINYDEAIEFMTKLIKN